MSTTPQKPLPVMVGVDRVHSLQLANPRGLLDFKDGVGVQAARGKRMAAERFIVRWARHVGRRPEEMNEGDAHPFRFWGNDGGVAAIPGRVGFGNEVSQEKMPFIAEN